MSSTIRTGPNRPQRGWLTIRERFIRVLQKVVAVREDEVATLLWSCAYVFCLLAGNYLIRPLRDEMGVVGGTRYLPWMFTGTLVAIVLVHPLFVLLVGNRPRRWFIPLLYRTLQFFLLAFFVLFATLPQSQIAPVARWFFVWASVCNLLVVSVVWGFLTDHLHSNQAHRLFGFISAGGTLGAIAGSAAATMLATHVGPLSLLVVAALLFEFGTLAVRRLALPEETCLLVDEPPQSLGEDTPFPHDRPARQRPSAYVFGLGLSVLLFTISSAFVYFEQARIVGSAFADPTRRTAFFARLDLMVNLLSLVVQVLLTGRVIAALGIGLTAALLPALTLAGFLSLAAWPTLATLTWFQVLRRALDYALARPSREIMFTVVRRSQKYRTKTFIDTAVYRAGDTLGAWTYGLLSVLPGGPRTLTALGVVLCLGWIGLSLRLGRQQKRMTSN